MADHPIIFTTGMAAALWDGRKRRRRLYVLKGQDPLSPDHLARRLANGVDKSEPDACWEWQRACNNEGYGTLTVDGKTVFAHRLAYELGKGGIPDGMQVLHECDNPRCINPSHLTAGTQSKNMADCYARGRSQLPSPRMNGESNGSAKLTAKEVRIIRDELSTGTTQRDLADRFNVSQALISRIKRGVIWNGVRPDLRNTPQEHRPDPDGEVR